MLGSRAAIVEIEGGSNVWCAHCGELIVFVARRRTDQIVANVYIKDKWDRVEHYHHGPRHDPSGSCYLAAGSPYGEPVRSQGRISEIHNTEKQTS